MRNLRNGQRVKIIPNYYKEESFRENMRPKEESFRENM